jgi:hypothetical protein
VNRVLGEPPDPREDGLAGEAAFRAVTQRRRRGPAVVTVAALAFVGFALLTKELIATAGTPVVGATQSSSLGVIATATASAIAQAAPDAASASGPPARDPTARRYATLIGDRVHAGTTQLIAGPTPVGVTVNLPTGWEAAGPSMYLKRPSAGPVGLSIGAYSIQHVNTFPCRWASQAYTDTAYPHTAAGLALALSAFWGQDPNQVPFFSNSTIAPISSRPRPTTIGGHPALHVEVLIPSVLDFSRCDADQLVLWESADGSVRYGFGPGEIDRLWVVDMNGAPVVIDAAMPLLASPSDRAELQAIVDSVRIEP